jgi:hypothetical protein
VPRVQVRYRGEGVSQCSKSLSGTSSSRDHRHKRSNVESTVNMIKAKFSDAVSSKTDTAMKNEVLAKILAHNICCLISAIYELKIEPVLGSAA